MRIDRRHRFAARAVGAFLGGFSGALAAGACADPPGPELSAPGARVRLSPPETAGLPGWTLQLEAVALDSAGGPVSGARFGWTPSHAARATVNDAGLVTFGAEAGPVRITAREQTSGVADSLALRTARDGELRWAVRVGDSTLQRYGGPAIDLDGAVWVVAPALYPNGAARSEVSRLSARGELLCQVTLDGVFENVVSIAPATGTAWVFGSTIYELDPGCGVVRSRTIEAPDAFILSGAVGPDGTLYAQTAFHLIAFTPVLDTLWLSPRSPRAAWLRPPAVAAGRVYAKVESDSLYAFRADNGALLWARPDPDSVSTTSGGHGVVVSGERVYLPNSHSFAAFDTSGTLLWKTPFGGLGVSEPIVTAAGRLINQEQANVLFESGGLIARDAQGNVLWNRASAGPWHYFGHGGPALAEGGIVYAAGLDGFYAYDLDGTLQWKVETVPGDSAWFAGSPAIAPDGTIYTWAATHVYAIFGSRPPDPTSPWPMWRGDAQRTGRGR